MDIASLGISVKLLSANEAARGLKDVAREAGAAERQAKKVEQSTRTLDGVMRGAAKAGAILGAALGTAFSAGALVSAIDKYTEMSNLLKVVATDQSGVNDQLARLADIANSTRTPLESVVTLFQRVSTTASELGVSGEQVEKFVTNISTALALQGGSAEQASGALLQLSQALAGGVVRAEEFNSIMEGAFPIMQAAARGIEGVDGSIGKLRQMMLDGELSAKVFFDAILSKSDELAASFGKTQATVGQALQSRSPNSSRSSCRKRHLNLNTQNTEIMIRRRSAIYRLLNIESTGRGRHSQQR
ncbi:MULTISPECIES: tape measure protein [unclassified Haematobacter]|uniref:tape measure protein n=1 Tax=unclassified Haematobacter TaxID=2640585 RepID=UPI0025C2EF3F|nr:MULTISPECIES: tape measure protein [unclassified Haematobacter]